MYPVVNSSNEGPQSQPADLGHSETAYLGMHGAEDFGRRACDVSRKPSSSPYNHPHCMPHSDSPILSNDPLHGPHAGNGRGTSAPSTLRKEGRRIVVANTHIVANPLALEVKLWQAQTLLTVLEKYLQRAALFASGEESASAEADDPPSSPPNFSPHLLRRNGDLDGSASLQAELQRKAPRRNATSADFRLEPDDSSSTPGPGGTAEPPLILVGDFNSASDSAVYSLLVSGRCDPSHPDLKSQEPALMKHLKLRHDLGLASAYALASALQAGARLKNGAALDSLKWEPAFTNYTTNYVGCLDYLFFQPEKVALRAVLTLPDAHDLQKESLALQNLRSELPSLQRPSDHLPLMGVFDLKDLPKE
eukprot:Polyplicarium_translucidae@DN1119_c0_g1_i4.p1